MDKINQTVFLITNIPTPYRKKQFHVLRNYVPNLNICFIKKDMEDREWEIENEKFYYFLDRRVNIPGFGILNKNLISLVRKTDVLIIGGYDHPTYLILALLAQYFKKPYILLFDGISPSRLKDEGNNIKTKLKHFIAKSASAIVANGEVGKLYFRDVLKINEKKIFNQYLSIDNNLFSKYLLVKDDINAQVRKDLQIHLKSSVVLYSGRFIKRKKIDDLIKAIEILNKKHDVTLLLLGSGEEKNELEKLCHHHAVQAVFPGFIDENELYKYYFISNVLVLPSKDEPWGLVVNEALASEVPVVLSNDVGASLDLVLEDVNGYVFEVGDVKDLASKIDKALSLPKDGIQRFSKELVKKWNIENSAEMLSRVVNYSLNVK